MVHHWLIITSEEVYCMHMTTPVFGSKVQMDDDAVSLADFLQSAAIIIEIRSCMQRLHLKNAQE